MAVQTQQKPTTRLIKRYNNRKLYDVEKSRYITLEGIRALVRAGEDIRVVDNDSGEDLTKLTLAQIIYEEEKKKSGILSLPLLRWLVERGDDAMRPILRGVEKSREALDSMREATEKRMQEFVEKSSDRSREFFEELISAPQRQLEQLQHRIDAQVERMTSHPAVRKELKRVEHSIKELEERLTKLTGTASPKSPPRKKSKKSS